MGFGSNPDMKFGGGGFGGGRRKSSGSGVSGGVDITTVINEADLKKLYTKLQMLPKKVGSKIAGPAGRAAAMVYARRNGPGNKCRGCHTAAP